MSFEVFLTDDAASDLDDLFKYIETQDGPERARHVLDQIEKRVNLLSEKPARGAYPRELVALGIREYPEVFFKPYCIIYRAAEEKVFVYLIADGRRDMQALLQRRMLRS
jgi:toxin ParE1/3/4